jgi:hypothetical protein
MTKDQHQELIDLSWRYAALIGITDMSDMLSEHELESDKRNWPQLIRNSGEGLAVFDDEDAVEFMMAHSGMSEGECAQVLSEEWDI